jgi:hypothetical protein
MQIAKLGNKLTAHHNMKFYIKIRRHKIQEVNVLTLINVAEYLELTSYERVYYGSREFRFPFIYRGSFSFEASAYPSAKKKRRSFETTTS